MLRCQGFAMFQRGIIITGAVVYLAVMGIVLSSGGGTPGTRAAGGGDAGLTGSGGANLEGLPFRSVGIQIQRVDWIDEYKKVMDKIADVGADTVMLVVDTRQENGQSSRIYLDFRMTPTTTQLGDLIDYAKSKQLRVVLMPVVLLDAPINGEWRGTIRPANWEDWWTSYREMMQVFSSVAEVHHV